MCDVTFVDRRLYIFVYLAGASHELSRVHTIVVFISNSVDLLVEVCFSQSCSIVFLLAHPECPPEPSYPLKPPPPPQTPTPPPPSSRSVLLPDCRLIH